MDAKIKKGDRVVVLTGKDKGRREVLKVLPKETAPRRRRQHGEASQRPTQADPKAASSTRKPSLHLSNVAIADPTASRPASASRSMATRRFASPRRSGDVIDG
jgi:large subunit ribosomal protein L24